MNNEKIEALSKLYDINLRAVNRVDENEVALVTKAIEMFVTDHYGEKDEAEVIRDAYECLVWLWFPLNCYYIRLIRLDKIVGLHRYPIKMKMRCPDVKGLHQKEFVKYVCVTLRNGENYKLHYVLDVKEFTNFMKQDDVMYNTYRDCNGVMVDCYYGKEMLE